MVSSAETVGEHLELRLVHGHGPEAGSVLAHEPGFGYVSGCEREAEVGCAHGFATGCVPGHARIEPEPEPKPESGGIAVPAKVEIVSAEP